ncbi:MAG: hypothetical protein Q9205_001490 [Flavoplaca limonia]
MGHWIAINSAWYATKASTAAIKSLQERVQACYHLPDTMNNDQALQQFRVRSDRLKIHDSERQELIEDLRPFVVVLIDADGDGYMFKDNFLNQNEKGGELAADELLAGVRLHLSDVSAGLSDVDIKVCAYANFNGLEKACKNRHMKATASLRLFATGFSGRHPLLDFVDVGAGKERADNKIRELLTFYTNQAQCMHILLGIAHDAGYVPFLQRFAADRSQWDTMTLLEGYQVNMAMEELRFCRRLKLPSVFVQAPSSTMNQTSSAPINQTHFAQKPDLISLIVTGGRLADSYKLVQTSFDCTEEMRGPMLTNEHGFRYDKPLNVTKEMVQSIEAQKLCPHLYVAGFCNGCACEKHLSISIDRSMWDALWVISRRTRCANRDLEDSECKDTRCIFGHGTKAEQNLRALRLAQWQSMRKP